MLKVLAGDLSATFNLDGGHLSRYLSRRKTVIQSLCDQLILHDQILVPTHDYLTAAGLIRLLGEKNVISLLEDDRLNFVRLRGIFGYARGTGPDGSLLTLEDPQQERPQDSPIEDSAKAALAEIRVQYIARKKLTRLLVERSHDLKTSAIVDAIRLDAYKDLEQTVLWKESYRYSKPSLLALPGMKSMQTRVLGPGTDISRNPVDALLALGLMNMELYLSEQFGCASTSSGYPIGDCIALKLPRLDHDHPARPHLWSFMEVAGVPDISDLLLADKRRMANFIKLIRSQNAQEFRKWFHSNAKLTEREIMGAYFELMHQVPRIQQAPAKALRFAITTAAGLVPVLGHAASAIDTFVVDKLLSGRSPKYFIDDLRKFSGRIKSRS